MLVWHAGREDAAQLRASAVRDAKDPAEPAEPEQPGSVRQHRGGALGAPHGEQRDQHHGECQDSCHREERSASAGPGE
jgi:hypothetical protein